MSCDCHCQPGRSPQDHFIQILPVCSSAEGVVTCPSSHSLYQHHLAKKICRRLIWLAGRESIPVGHSLARAAPQPCQSLSACSLFLRPRTGKSGSSSLKTPQSILHLPEMPQKMGLWSPNCWGWFVSKEANNLQGGTDYSRTFFTR